MITSLRNAGSCFDCELWLSLVNSNYETPLKNDASGTTTRRNDSKCMFLRPNKNWSKPETRVLPKTLYQLDVSARTIVCTYSI